MVVYGVRASTLIQKTVLILSLRSQPTIRQVSNISYIDDFSYCYVGMQSVNVKLGHH